MFMGLLVSIVNASNQTKCVSLTNQKCITQSTLINLHPNECSQEFLYYPFLVNLDRCVGSFDNLNGLSNKVCLSNKRVDLKLNMITGIYWLKTLRKHISCKCNFDGRNWNSDQWWNKDKCRRQHKTRHVREKDYIWNPATSGCENGKYLASIMDDSAITCDEIIESYVEEINFNGNKAIFKMQSLYLNVFIRAYNLIINRMTRSKNMMAENNNQIDLKFWF